MKGSTSGTTGGRKRHRSPHGSLVFGAGIAVLALALAACGTSTQARKQPVQKVKAKTVKATTTPTRRTAKTNQITSASVVAAAARRTLATKSAGLLLGISPSSLSIRTDGKVVHPSLLAPSNGQGAPQQGIISYQIHGTGSFDFVSRIGQFQLGTAPPSTPAQAGTGTSQWILTSKYAYQSVPKIPYGPTTSGSNAAPLNSPAWIKIPLSAQPSGTAFATAGPSLFTFEVFSPQLWLDALAGLQGTVLKEGSGSFEGKAVAYYQTTVPSSDLQFLTKTGPVQVEAAIDSSGMIREIAAVVAAPSAVSPSSNSPAKAQGGYTAMLVTIGLIHFGTTVAISIPPASQTDIVLNPTVAREEHAAHPNGTSTGTPAPPSPAPPSGG